MTEVAVVLKIGGAALQSHRALSEHKTLSISWSHYPLSSFILKRSVKLALAGAPLILAVSALVLTLWGSDKIVATGVAIIWGLTFALVPVGWSTWITRSLADQAEKAGSIQVAVIQLANTCGAAIGGYAMDNIGLTSPLMLSGTLMLLTALLVTAKVKMKKS